MVVKYPIVLECFGELSNPPPSPSATSIDNPACPPAEDLQASTNHINIRVLHVQVTPVPSVLSWSAPADAENETASAMKYLPTSLSGDRLGDTIWLECFRSSITIVIRKTATLR